jgi:hypothetical protein
MVVVAGNMVCNTMYPGKSVLAIEMFMLDAMVVAVLCGL